MDEVIRSNVAPAWKKCPFRRPCQPHFNFDTAVHDAESAANAEEVSIITEFVAIDCSKELQLSFSIKSLHVSLFLIGIALLCRFFEHNAGVLAACVGHPHLCTIIDFTAGNASQSVSRYAYCKHGGVLWLFP